MKPAIWLVVTVALSGAIGWAFSLWLLPAHVADVVTTLTFCR